MSTQELQLAILHDVTCRLGDVRKIRLQKLVYFLQEALGVPTKFQFRMHHYGPYADSLETNTARLKLAGYVNVEPDLQGYGFHITPTDEPQEEWRQLIQPYKERIDEVINALGDLQIRELELAATIHYVKRLRPNLPNHELLGMVRALKPKFEEDYVSQVRAKLEDLKMLL